MARHTTLHIQGLAPRPTNQAFYPIGEEDGFLIKIFQAPMVLLLVAAFFIVAGLPTWLMLFYDKYIPRAAFVFLDPLAWLCLMWVRQTVRYSVNRFVSEDHRKLVMRIFSIVYLSIVIVNAICGLWFLPRFHDSGPHSPQSQQLLGLFFVVITFFLLESKWVRGKTVFGSEFRTWNRSKLAISFKDLLGELKLVGVVTATLIGGLVHEGNECLTTANVTKVALPFGDHDGGDHDGGNTENPCNMVYIESTVVYIWLWFLFFDLALARVANNHNFYNVATTVAGLATFAEHIMLMADTIDKNNLVLIFGSIRRGVQLIVMLVVLFEGDRKFHRSSGRGDGAAANGHLDDDNSDGSGFGNGTPNVGASGFAPLSGVTTFVGGTKSAGAAAKGFEMMNPAFGGGCDGVSGAGFGFHGGLGDGLTSTTSFSRPTRQPQRSPPPAKGHKVKKSSANSTEETVGLLSANDHHPTYHSADVLGQDV